MKLINKLFPIITVLSMGGLLQAMEPTTRTVQLSIMKHPVQVVTLPSAETISECLNANGLQYFAEKTNIAKDLGGKEMPLLSVPLAVHKHIFDYVKKYPEDSIMWMFKQDIIDCLLPKGG